MTCPSSPLQRPRCRHLPVRLSQRMQGQLLPTLVRTQGGRQGKESEGAEGPGGAHGPKIRQLARKGYGEKRVWRKKGMAKKRVWRKKGYGEKKGMVKNERAPRWTNMTNPAIHPEAGPFKEPRCVHCQYIPSSPVRVRREPPGFLHLTACPRYISHPVPPNFLARRRRPVLPPRPEYPALPSHPSRPLTLPPKARGREDPSPSPPP